MTLDSPILVTGATGFVGRYVVRALLARGYNVAAIIRRSSSPPPRLKNTEWIPKEFAQDWIKHNKPSAVVHLATSYGTGSFADVVETNLLFPLTLLETSANCGCSLFVATDTFSGKGDATYPFRWPYTRSKNDFSAWARMVVQLSKSIRIANLRLEHVYGAEDGKDKFVTRMIARLRANEPVIELTPGDQIRDFVFVEDVASAYVTVLQNMQCLDQYFTEIEVGRGQGCALRDFVSTLARALDSRSELRFGALPHRQFEMMTSIADISWLVSAGWKPLYDIEQGIARMLSSERQVTTD